MGRGGDEPKGAFWVDMGLVTLLLEIGVKGNTELLVLVLLWDKVIHTWSLTTRNYEQTRIEITTNKDKENHNLKYSVLRYPHYNRIPTKSLSFQLRGLGTITWLSPNFFIFLFFTAFVPSRSGYLSSYSWCCWEFVTGFALNGVGVTGIEINPKKTSAPRF